MLNLIGTLLSILDNKTAYLDPGSGSFLLQLLIAGLVGIGIALRASWGKIRGLFGQSKAKTEETEDESDE